MLPPRNYGATALKMQDFAAQDASRNLLKLDNSIE